MRAHLARVDAVLVQALIAAALSFAHIHDIATAAGQDGWKAWAYPISVDLLLVAASVRRQDSALRPDGPTESAAGACRDGDRDSQMPENPNQTGGLW
ncbi:DUF2637 domain-containing protein, partial [Streptomyces canus]|uniref:DUF2637 domain-containing protein n=1 Tax=Streptomyces canus TaxID=58343 RepID=UPI00048C57B9